MLSSRGSRIRLGLLVAGIGLCIWVFFRFPLPNCVELREIIVDSGAWGPLVYLALATLAMLLCIPRTVVAVLAGVAFDFWPGVWLLAIASMLSAFFAFLIARYLARDAVLRWLSVHPWFQHLCERVQERSFSVVLFVRVIHLFPYGPLNYAFGLLPVREIPFLIATFIGLFPGGLALVYAGNTLGCALMEGKASLPPDIQRNLILIAVVMGILTILPILINRKKRP